MQYNTCNISYINICVWCRGSSVEIGNLFYDQTADDWDGDWRKFSCIAHLKDQTVRISITDINSIFLESRHHWHNHNYARSSNLLMVSCTCPANILQTQAQSTNQKVYVGIMFCCVLLWCTTICLGHCVLSSCTPSQSIGQGGANLQNQNYLVTKILNV